MKEAQYYKKLENDEVLCQLCPHMCKINDGDYGKCGVRKNSEGKLLSVYYGKPCTITYNDPIEKKPLYHFMPKERVLSIATFGCNLFCLHCQNWDISQKREQEKLMEGIKPITPKEIVNKAKKENIKIIAYTYTEPTIFYEYMKDIMLIAKEEGIKNVMVSNGYINPKPIKELIEKKLIDGINIDLKSIKEEFYEEICGTKILPVLNTIKTLYEAGVWMEITNLLIPTKNDTKEEIKELVKWIKNNLSQEIPIHFSAFYPQHKLTDINPTEEEKIIGARKIALNMGMKYVYTGNIIDLTGRNNTYCENKECKTTIIERQSFKTKKSIHNMYSKRFEGVCIRCGEKIPGIWG